MNFKNLGGYIWTIPFIAFLFGYVGLRVALHKKRLSTPNVIGKNVQEALTMTSDAGLNLRSLKEVESADFKAGTVLEQQPLANFPIQLNQSVFVVVIKKKGTSSTPNFMGMSFDEIQKKSHDLGIKTKIIFSQSSHPKDSCFAQFPLPEQALEDKNIVLYISSGNSEFMIVPNYKGKKVLEVENIAEKNNITLNFVLKRPEISEDKKNLIIVDQKPIPGSIVDFGKKLYLQLLVDQ